MSVFLGQASPALQKRIDTPTFGTLPVLTGIVYGAYLLVTHFASRSIIRASLGKKLLG